MERDTRVIGIKGISDTLDKSIDVIETDVKALLQSDTIEKESARLRYEEKEILLNIGNLDNQAQYLTQFEGSMTRVRKTLDQILKKLQSGPDVEQQTLDDVQKLSSNMELYYKGAKKTIDSAMSATSLPPQESDKLMEAYRAIEASLRTARFPKQTKSPQARFLTICNLRPSRLHLHHG